MSIANQIARLQNAKTRLKEILTKNGVETKNVKLDEMVELVNDIVGADTSDATATSGDILLGKTAYAKREKVVGTIGIYDYSYAELKSLTDEQISALEKMVVVLDDTLQIEYEKDILDMEFYIEDKNLMVDNKLTGLELKINENKELEAIY